MYIPSSQESKILHACCRWTASLQIPLGPGRFGIACSGASFSEKHEESLLPYIISEHHRNQKSFHPYLPVPTETATSMPYAFLSPSGTPQLFEGWWMHGSISKSRSSQWTTDLYRISTSKIPRNVELSIRASEAAGCRC